MNGTDCSLALQSNGWNGLIALQMPADNPVRSVVMAVDDFIKCYMTGKKRCDALKTWFVEFLCCINLFSPCFPSPTLVHSKSNFHHRGKLHLFVFSTNNRSASCRRTQFSLTAFEFCPFVRTSNSGNLPFVMSQRARLPLPGLTKTPPTLFLMPPCFHFLLNIWKVQ